ncbi:MAG: class I SAM-dependent methyltransferase [Candidatus Latescibacterota bacterium]
MTATSRRGSAAGFWDRVWMDPANQGYWRRASPPLVALAHMQSPLERPDVLDLGCGLGRNSVVFARQGFRVTAVDVSPAAVAQVRACTRELGLEVRTAVASFLDDAFPPESFDMVLAVNVLYHAHGHEFARALGHVRGWLRPGGLLYLTCPSLEDVVHNPARQVGPDTWELEPGHVHCCFGLEDLRERLAGFRLTSVERCEHHRDDGTRHRISSRWRIHAEKA